MAHRAATDYDREIQSHLLDATKSLHQAIDVCRRVTSLREMRIRLDIEDRLNPKNNKNNINPKNNKNNNKNTYRQAQENNRIIERRGRETLRVLSHLIAGISRIGNLAPEDHDQAIREDVPKSQIKKPLKVINKREVINYSEYDDEDFYGQT